MGDPAVCGGEKISLGPSELPRGAVREGERKYNEKYEWRRFLPFPFGNAPCDSTAQ